MTKTVTAVYANVFMVVMGAAACAAEFVVPPRERTAHATGTQTLDGSSREFDWIPPWRQKGDCGPLALFVLMKLQGETVTLDDVRGLTPVDPERGCSLADLNRTADSLGMQAEVQFVNPRDLSRIPLPVIVHGMSSLEKGLGHFRVVVDHDPNTGRYAVIEPFLESLAWYSEETLLNGYSGYVLTAQYPISRQWVRSLGYGLVLVGSTILLLWLYATMRRRRAAGT